MRDRNTRVWPLWTTLAIALGAICTFSLPRGVGNFGPSHPLSLLEPSPPRGWTERDTPLGADELEAGETLRTLNFSDYFYKTYRNGAMEVQLYVAYWRSGKMDPSLVAVHRPAVCWVGNGAIPLANDVGFILRSPDGAATKPGSYGAFQFPSSRVEVVFWHRYGSQVTSFSSARRNFWSEHVLPAIGSFRASLSPQDQLVYRISTNETLDAITKSALWPGLRVSLERARLLAGS